MDTSFIAYLDIKDTEKGRIVTILEVSVWDVACEFPEEFGVISVNNSVYGRVKEDISKANNLGRKNVRARSH